MRLASLIPATLLTCIVFMTFPLGALAQDATKPAEISAVYACKSFTEPMARLACYDKAVGRLEAAEESGEVVTVSKTEVEKVKRDAFGFNIPSLPGLGKLFKKDKPKQTAINRSDTNVSNTDTDTKASNKKKNNFEGMKAVSLEIKETTEFGYGKTRFFLANGQVWEQTSKDSIRVPKVRDGVPNTVEIRKASLGSFLMRVNGKGKATRVRRVR